MLTVYPIRSLAAVLGRDLRRSLFLLPVWLTLGCFQAWCAQPLRLAVSLTPLSLPVFVADSQGYFAAEGLSYRIDEVVGGHRTMQQVFDGTADLATSSDAVIMFNSFQRKDYLVLATFVSSDDDVKLVAAGASGIVRPQQLAGKRVGTVVGAASHYYLDTLLLLDGVDPRTVKVSNLQPETMAEALRKGEVDAVAIWEPIPFKILEAVPGAKMLTKSAAYKLSFNLVMPNTLRGLRDDDIVKLLRALERAVDLIHSDPKRAQAIMRQRLGLDQRFVDWIWPRYKYRLALDQSLLTTLEAEARWAIQEGHVKSRRAPDYLDYIYSLPLRKLRPGAVSIVE